MNDKEKIEQLETRVDQLEATIRKMLPSRRDALKLGVAGVAGASIVSGTASANAGTNNGEVGTIGDASNSVDIFVQDIEGLETINSDNIVTVRDPADPNDNNTSRDYQIIKGTDSDDGTGVINFKTS